MTAEELGRCGERLYGAEWRGRLAQALGVNVRTVQRWASGRNEVPERVGDVVLSLLWLRDGAEEQARHRVFRPTFDRGFGGHAKPDEK